VVQGEMLGTFNTLNRYLLANLQRSSTQRR
jgi:hypothetical protein